MSTYMTNAIYVECILAERIFRQISHCFETILTPSTLLMMYIQKVYVVMNRNERRMLGIIDEQFRSHSHREYSGFQCHFAGDMTVNKRNGSLS